MTIPTETTVVARRGAAAAVLRDCQGLGSECLLVFGGLPSSGGRIQNTDVLMLGDSDPTWTSPAGAKVGDRPPAVEQAAMVADPTGRIAVMFGGRTGGNDDTATDAFYAINTAGWADQSLLANIALGRPVYHSNPYPLTDARYHPSNLVDGLTSSFASSFQCAIALQTKLNPTISIDLGGPRVVTELEVWPRTDASQYDNTIGTRFSVNNHRTDPLAGDYHECENTNTGRLPRPSRISCGGAVGRYVHNFKVGTHKLDMCEIRVLSPQPYTWRKFHNGEVEVAAGKPAIATRQGWNGQASNINDGTKD